MVIVIDTDTQENQNVEYLPQDGRIRIAPAHAIHENTHLDFRLRSNVCGHSTSNTTRQPGSESEASSSVISVCVFVTG
jgi:hypothetical protein